MVDTRKRSIKSKQLRKYEIAYNKCIKFGLKSKRNNKAKSRSKKCLLKSSRKPHRNQSLFVKSRKRVKKSRSKSRSLNSYQKFVKSESSKSIYKGISVKSRMRAIAKKWRKFKC